MTDRGYGFKVAYHFFRIVCKLKLIPDKRLSFDLWQLVREMVLKKENLDAP